MAILLKDLLCEISNAICNANSIMENAALHAYVGQGYKKQEYALNDEEEVYIPLTFNMTLQQGAEIKKIPISALMHNSTMRLEQVDMKLKFKMHEENNEILVDCMPKYSKDETLDEMTIQFKNCVAAEGISKITDVYIEKM